MLWHQLRTEESFTVRSSLHLVDGALEDGRIVVHLTTTRLEGDNLLMQVALGKVLRLVHADRLVRTRLECLAVGAC